MNRCVGKGPLIFSPQSRKYRVVLVAALVTAGAVALLGRAQSPGGGPPAGRSVVVLDPAHGGPDAGAKLGDSLAEKDLTLALAARLRATLVAAGFTVISTRDSDPLTLLPNDQRAETANRAHAVACLVIHATGSGSGVHLYTSTLRPKDPVEPMGDADSDVRPAFAATPWETAQAESVTQSGHLASDLSAALTAASLPVLAGKASVRPLDNMMCPAVAVEVAPLGVAGGDRTSVSDAGYQQRLADALTKALQSWRTHALGSTP